MFQRHSKTTPPGTSSRSNSHLRRSNGNHQHILDHSDVHSDNDPSLSHAAPLVDSYSSSPSAPPSSPGRSGSQMLEVMNGAHDDATTTPLVHHRRQSSAYGHPTGATTAVSSSPASAPASSMTNHLQHHHPAALPGRPTRRKKAYRGGHSKSSGGGRHGFCYRVYHRWCRQASTAKRASEASSSQHLWIAVALWYSLGVISIGTSKVLLSDHELGSVIGNVPPVYLTFQQLLIGSTLLRLWISRGAGSSSPSPSRIQPWPLQSSVATGTSNTNGSYDNHHYLGKMLSSASATSLLSWGTTLRGVHPSLLWAALYFALGFLFTNMGFSGAPASFVETVKASEPITSASVAALWKIESLTGPETVSLLAIVAGVALSTAGNHHGSTSSAATNSSTSSSIWSCAVILLSNLCFSFRGLHQKLFRATPEGSTGAVDDWNLQFRMQQLGAAGLVLPVLLWEGRTLWNTFWHVVITMPLQEAGLPASLRLVGHYALLSLCNGCAFTFYNLSSTYILSRISVVHHAALNCIRRVFAIVVTSILFRVPMTTTGALGILCSVVGFMAFSHFKVQKQQNAVAHPSYLPTSAVAYTPSSAR
jgi:drug/metabolite transporter (DMT)-like permease